MRHVLADKPIGQGLQTDRRGGKGSHLFAHLASDGGEQQTGDDRLLVDVESCTARVQCDQTHCQTPFCSAILAADEEWSAARGAKGTTRFLLVLTGGPVVTLSSAGRARISLKHGLGYQIPTISSRCRLLYSSPFSCFSLRRSIMALETATWRSAEGNYRMAKWLWMSVRN